MAKTASALQVKIEESGDGSDVEDAQEDGGGPVDAFILGARPSTGRDDLVRTVAPGA